MYLLRQNLNVEPYYVKNNFLNDSEIDKIKELSSFIEPENGQIGTDCCDHKNNDLNSHIKNVGVGKNESIRKSILRWIQLDDDTNWLYKKIILSVKEVNSVNFDYILTFIEMLQFTEYNEHQGGMYKKHNDCGSSDDMSNSVDIRKLSFSIQLSDDNDYVGGDLILYNKENENQCKIMDRKKGSIIFFCSDIEHEVTPVTKGTRYSLVGWVNGPNLR